MKKVPVTPYRRVPSENSGIVANTVANVIAANVPITHNASAVEMCMVLGIPMGMGVP